VAVTLTKDADGVATVRIDDGKVNALDVDVFHELDEAFDASADASAIVVAGREGVFSAGLNMRLLPQLDAWITHRRKRTVTDGCAPDASPLNTDGEELDRRGLSALFVAFATTAHRIWLEPRPVVAAVTGHAIAGGTILAMACDHTVAAQGDFRWGLTETSLGFVMPDWVIALARANVRADRLEDLILPGATISPEQAVECGFADVLASPGMVVEMALTKARALATLPRAVYAATKRRLRGPASEAALANLERDAAAMSAVDNVR